VHTRKLFDLLDDKLGLVRNDLHWNWCSGPNVSHQLALVRDDDNAVSHVFHQLLQNKRSVSTLDQSHINANLVGAVDDQVKVVANLYTVRQTRGDHTVVLTEPCRRLRARHDFDIVEAAFFDRLSKVLERKGGGAAAPDAHDHAVRHKVINSLGSHQGLLLQEQVIS
jgi:hypothetical protein